MPASNMKIVTLAAAAEKLGWDYRYETTVVAAGADRRRRAAGRPRRRRQRRSEPGRRRRHGRSRLRRLGEPAEGARHPRDRRPRHRRRQRRSTSRRSDSGWIVGRPRRPTTRPASARCSTTRTRCASRCRPGRRRGDSAAVSLSAGTQRPDDRQRGDDRPRPDRRRRSACTACRAARTLALRGIDRARRRAVGAGGVGRQPDAVLRQRAPRRR